MAEKKSLKVLPPEEPAGSACTRVVGGLTDEEVLLLERMRLLKDEMRVLREGAEPGTPPNDKRVFPEDSAARLKILEARMSALKGERATARRRRMILLGHDEAE